MKTTLAVLFLLLSVSSLSAAETHEPPEWAKHVVWYQLFVERFNNGDTTNDPRVEWMRDEKMNILPPAGWKVTPWTQSWYSQDDWMKGSKSDFNALLQYRRYGGDLQGVMDKIDYLQELGVTAIYFNPLNDAPSLHKFDARHYHHIDINFGPDPEGDLRIIASEDLNDPSTWQWTSADRLFLKLVEALHQRGIRVIVDFSWNHTGTQHPAWLDVISNQEDSPYRNWYNIGRFDDPATPENEFTYEGWMGNAYMPEIKKVDITTERRPGNPYEGNIHPDPKAHIFAATQRWLAPDGDVTRGIDGFRLDVADHIGLGFWREWRDFVRTIQPEAYLIGEVWWQQWPNDMMDPLPYLRGDVFDAVMFYQIYRPARYFFAQTDLPIDAAMLRDSLQYHWNRLDRSRVEAMMNVSSSHDAPRLTTDFYNPNKYKYHANTHENPAFRTGKPDEESMRRLRMYLMHLFTIPGAPQIWNGEEMGMWGADDPHCRKPLTWPELNFEPERRQALQKGDKPTDKVAFDRKHFEFYRQLISLRKAHPVLSTGEMTFLRAEGHQLVYSRTNEKEEIVVLFNVDPRTARMALPVGAQYKDALTGKKHSGHLRLKGLSGAILIRQ